LGRIGEGGECDGCGVGEGVGHEDVKKL